MRISVVALVLAVLVTACGQVIPTPTPSPVPVPPPTATPWSTEDMLLAAKWDSWEWDGAIWVGIEANPGVRTAYGAELRVGCYQDLQATDVRVLFDFAMPTERPGTEMYLPPTPAPIGDGRFHPTPNPLNAAVARAVEADDALDDIHISRRDVGEIGRWLKSGWQHYPSTGGYLVLRQSPADAFIRELKQVDELALLLTHDDAHDTTAVFSVQGLPYVLANDVDWDC